MDCRGRRRHRRRGPGSLNRPGFIALSALVLAAATASCRACQRETRDATAPLTAGELRQLAGDIVFVSERSGHPETFVIRADGTGERRLVEGHILPAAVSPGGEALLAIAVSEREGNHEERLLKLSVTDGGTPTALGAATARIRTPSWSNDGRAIVFTSSEHGYSDIVWMNADGTGARRLTSDPHGAFDPSLSPDGKSLAFVSTREGDPEIYRLDLATGDVSRLTAFHLEDTAPQWSPTGQLISFISNREGHDALFVMAPDGSGQRRVVGSGKVEAEAELTDATRFDDREAAWSPDGKRIAFVRRQRNGASRIWVANVSAGTASALTDAKSEAAMPCWSPDGAHIAFTSDRTGNSEIFVMRADGSAQTQLTRAPGADWRPLWTVLGHR